MDREVREIPPANDSSSHFRKQNREYPCARRGCKDASPIVSFLFGELRSISRDDGRGEKFFSTRAPLHFSTEEEEVYLVCTSLCARPILCGMSCFFAADFYESRGRTLARKLHGDGECSVTFQVY